MCIFPRRAVSLRHYPMCALLRDELVIPVTMCALTKVTNMLIMRLEAGDPFSTKPCVVKSSGVGWCFFPIRGSLSILMALLHQKCLIDPTTDVSQPDYRPTNSLQEASLLAFSDRLS